MSFKWEAVSIGLGIGGAAVALMTYVGWKFMQWAERKIGTPTPAAKPKRNYLEPDILGAWVKFYLVWFPICLVLNFATGKPWPAETFWLVVAVPPILFYGLVISFTLAVAVIVFPVWLVKRIWQAV